MKFSGIVYISKLGNYMKILRCPKKLKKVFENLQKKRTIAYPSLRMHCTCTQLICESCCKCTFLFLVKLSSVTIERAMTVLFLSSDFEKQDRLWILGNIIKEILSIILSVASSCYWFVIWVLKGGRWCALEQNNHKYRF